MDRRRFVKLAGMASVATTAGLAGCQGDDDSGGDDNDEDTEETTAGDGTPTTEETPDGEGDDSDNEDDSDDGSPDDLTVSSGEMAAYNSWVVPESVNNQQVLAISLDTQALAQTDNSDGSQDEELQNDPLAALPVSFLFIGALSTAGLGNAGLGSLTEEGSPTEQLHVISGALVLEGPYDAGSLGSDVESAGLSESEQYNGYTIYTGDGQAIGISDSAVIVVNEGGGGGVSDSVARVKTHIDASAGNGTLYSDQEAKFADLVTALPNRTVTGVIYTTEAAPLNEDTGGDTTGSFADTGLDGRGNGLALSANIQSNSMTSSMAIRYESESEVNDQSTIESSLGTAADARGISIDGPLAVVEGEYSAVPSLNQQG